MAKKRPGLMSRDEKYYWEERERLNIIDREILTEWRKKQGVKVVSKPTAETEKQRIAAIYGVPTSYVGLEQPR